MLRTRIEAARAALQANPCPQLSKAQADAIAHDIEVAAAARRVSGSDAVSLAGSVASIPWQSPRDAQFVEAALHSALDHVGRQKLQNFEAVTLYFSAEQWTSLQSVGLDFMAKSRLVCDHVVMLGGRNLSEHTFAVLLAVAMCSENLHVVTGAQLRDSYLFFKKLFRQRSKVPTLVRISELPPSPDALRAFQPDLWAAAFGLNEPAPPPASFSMCLVAIKQKLVMRHRAISISGASSDGGAPAIQDTHLPQMAQAFMALAGVLGRPGEIPLGSGANLLMSGASPPRQQPGFALESPSRSSALALPPRQLCVPPMRAPSFLASEVGELDVSLAQDTSSFNRSDAVGDAPAGQGGGGLPAGLARDSLPDAEVHSVHDATQHVLSAMSARDHAKGIATRSAASQGARVQDTRANAKCIMKRPAAAPKALQNACPAAAQNAPTAAQPMKRKKAHWDDEASRSQILFRSGLRGRGSTKSFKYTDQASRARAIAQADELVRLADVS